MWYSIHSRLMVMSPSKKWNRGLDIRSATRSEPMSMPNTSQPVSARMRWDRWWPMKPLTPRMQSFFTVLLDSSAVIVAEGRRGDRRAAVLDLGGLERSAVAAVEQHPTPLAAHA